MRVINDATIGILLLLSFIVVCALPCNAQDLSASVCDVMIYDEQSELEDAQNAADLAKSDFAAYDRIFSMIETLWKAGTVPEMDYTKAKYDRDASQIKLEQADLILDRQSALVEQYQRICNRVSSGANNDRAAAIRKAFVRYRQSDCAALAKAIDVASTNLEYNRKYLVKIVKLRQENNANQTQVILAELDVEREEKNLADAKRRTGVCRSEMENLNITK